MKRLKSRYFLGFQPFLSQDFFLYCLFQSTSVHFKPIKLGYFQYLLLFQHHISHCKVSHLAAIFCEKIRTRSFNSSQLIKKAPDDVNFQMGKIEQSLSIVITLQYFLTFRPYLKLLSCFYQCIYIFHTSIRSQNSPLLP